MTIDCQKTTNGNPIVQFVLEEIKRQKIPHKEIAWRSGVNFKAFYRWKYLGNPTLPNIIAVLNALGYKLEIVKNEENN